MLPSFELALDECLVDDYLGRDIGEFALLPVSTCFRIGSKLRCIRSTLTEMQSISEKNFECFARTGVNTPGTMLPYSRKLVSSIHHRQGHSWR